MAEENGRTIIRHDEQLKHINEKIDGLSSCMDGITEKIDNFLVANAKREERLDLHCQMKIHDPAYVIGIGIGIFSLLGLVAKTLGLV